jgi:hypothetical protein
VDQGKKNKGTNENAPKAPVPTKKAKIATPEKTDSDVDSSDEDISDEDISDEDISDDDSSDEETPVQKVINCCTMHFSVLFFIMLYAMIVLCADYASTYTWFLCFECGSGQEQQETK